MYYTYETNRLILRVLDGRSAADVLAFYEKNREFESVEPARSQNFYTEPYQHYMLDYDYNSILKDSSYRYWLFTKEAPTTIIGTVSIRNILRGPYQKCEIGYKLDKNHRNKGYATEALGALISLIFHDLKLHRIEASCMTDNLASIKLLNKFGFKREGILNQFIEVNGQYEDHYLFSLINPDQA